MTPNEAVEKVTKRAILNARENTPIFLVTANNVAVVHENAIHEEIVTRLTIAIEEAFISHRRVSIVAGGFFYSLNETITWRNRFSISGTWTQRRMPLSAWIVSRTGARMALSIHSSRIMADPTVDGLPRSNV